MGYKMLTFMFAAILICGCSDRMSYHHTTWDSQGNKTEYTKIVHSSSPGNTRKDDIKVIIGDKENPQAYLSVGTSIADMDKFYETVSEVSQLMESFILKYMSGGAL